MLDPVTSAPVWDSSQTDVLSLPTSASAVVIGAPGAGKTRVVVERTRRLLESHEVAADEVLVLTPSRQTATRVRDVLGVQTTVATPGALARSVGSLAFQIVRAAAAFASAPPPQLLTGADQDRLVADLLESDADDEMAGTFRWPPSLPPAARGSQVFRSELRAFLAECAQLDVGASELAAIAERTTHESWGAIASFLADYRAVLSHMRSAHRESAELISEAAQIVRDASPEGGELGALGRLRVVLVDDAQELTRGGLDLLRALRGRGVAVLAFGDPDISSGSFRGATPQLFADLAAELVTVHVLTGAHRQSDALQHVTRSLTQAIGVSGRVEHRRPPGEAPQPDGSVIVRLADSPYAEADIIARTLREWHVLHGIEWQQMAVIAHDTRQVSTLETELAAREVPTRAAGIQRPLGRESAVRDILRLLEIAMTVPSDWDGEDLALALLSPFGGLDAVGLRRLRARLRHRELAAGGTMGAVPLLARSLASPLELSVIDTPEARAAERLAVTLAHVREAYLRGDTVHDLLWLVWERARIFGRPLAEVWREQSAATGATAAEASRSLDALVALFDAAKRAVERAPEAGAEAFIRELLGSDVPEDSLASPARAGSVTVMTPATALGAEYEAVVIAGVQDGVWPNVRLRGTLLDTWQLAGAVEAFRLDDKHTPTAATDRRKVALHDELRLFVRAVSRARSRLVVTAVDDDDTGPSALFAFLPEPSPNDDLVEHPLTLRGLVAEHRRTLTSDAGIADATTRQRAAAELALLAQEGVPGADPQQWYGIAPLSSTAPLRDPERTTISVSPSRMKNLHDCPVDWAIRSLGGNTSSFSTGLGTILHAAMEEVADGNIQELTAFVESRWPELEFEADWIAEKEKKWAATLIARIAAYEKNFRKNAGERVQAEAEFEVVVPFSATTPADVFVRGDEAPALPAAVVRGSIDRVERYPADRGEDLPIDPNREGQDRVVIVDLKTGKSEKRVSNDKVTEDPQLAAYQLAVRAGAVNNVAPDEGAGARLVVISQTLKDTHYRIAHQAPMTPEQQSAFISQVVASAQTMASESFTANIDTHCQDERFAVCRIHTVGAVSAS
ncbi:ATP-dependent DNA helicase [Microbacterium sp. NC79]|uniref:ATP-dependent DNA helicase n=1 Tax=Microbacterium sp. NC79 TaxID=2851009 RepID=UPI001C2C9045|nr:ATP-dependent DNA helicase [Microbacterium sp. NC79]MBV0894530.1 ATP-dependent helicase [Microbacterium sp. NC79]